MRWAAKHRIGCVVLLKPGRNLARQRQSFPALYLARISLTLFSPSSFSTPTDRSRVSTNPCVRHLPIEIREAVLRARYTVFLPRFTCWVSFAYEVSRVSFLSTVVRVFNRDTRGWIFLKFRRREKKKSLFIIVINSIFFVHLWNEFEFENNSVNQENLFVSIDFFILPKVYNFFHRNEAEKT